MKVNKHSKISKFLFAISGIASAFILISAGYSANKIKTEKVECYVPAPMRSNGAAQMGLGDRTGSPIGGAGASCANCHSGGTYNPTISINVLDSNLDPVTSYTPGDTYTIEYTVVSGAGSPAGFGVQGLAIDAAEDAAGNLTSIITANTQITASGGVQYVEHSSISTSGIFSAFWTAPNVGTGTVSIYARGLAVNGNGGTSGDESSTSVSLGLTEAVSTTISYSGTPFCGNDVDPAPSIAGETGGTFSAPAGLVINANSGVLDISNSTQGTYQVDYQYSQGTTSASVTINPTYNETASAAICSYETITFGSQTLDATNVGSNTEIFQSINGCDSTVVLDLTVNNVNTSVTQTGSSLSADETGLSYQWVNCPSYSLINGATDQTYQTSDNGDYAVIITENGCSDTSDCFTVSGLGIIENDFGNAFILYPNPTKGEFSIDLGKNYQSIAVTISDLSGRSVSTKTYTELQTLTLRLEEPTGIYLLKIESGNKKAVIRLVKE